MSLLIRSIVDGYPQTWALVCVVRRIPLIGGWMYRRIQSACPHDWSRTEWAWGECSETGEIDVHCRWCNAAGTMPLRAALLRWPQIRGTVYRHMPQELEKLNAARMEGSMSLTKEQIEDIRHNGCCAINRDWQALCDMALRAAESSPQMTDEEILRRVYDEAWKNAYEWANEPDIAYDMASPAYLKEREQIIAKVRGER